MRWTQLSQDVIGANLVGMTHYMNLYKEGLTMTKITVYDLEAEALEKIADANDTTVAEVVEMLMAYAEEMRKDNNLN